MYFTDTDNYKYYLCEYPVDPQCNQEAGISSNNHRNALVKYSGDTNSHLHSYLSSYFKTDIGRNASVAIFYTQQAMPAVSTILGVNPVVAECQGSASTAPRLPGQGPECKLKLPPVSECPLPISLETSKSCYDAEDKLLSWPGKQRSSVNIFYFQDTFVKQYTPPSENFPAYPNVLFLKFYQCFNFNNTTEKLSNEYYCQWSGSLGNDITLHDNETTIGKNHVRTLLISEQKFVGHQI